MTDAGLLRPWTVLRVFNVLFILTAWLRSVFYCLSCFIWCHFCSLLLGLWCRLFSLPLKGQVCPTVKELQRATPDEGEVTLISCVVNRYLTAQSQYHINLCSCSWTTKQMSSTLRWELIGYAYVSFISSKLELLEVLWFFVYPVLFLKFYFVPSVLSSFPSILVGVTKTPTTPPLSSERGRGGVKSCVFHKHSPFFAYWPACRASGF